MIRFDNRAVPIALAAVLIDTIGFGIIMPIFPRLITQLGHIDLEQATRVAGYMLVVFSVMQFFAGPVLGNLSDRFGRRPVLMTSMLCFGVDYVLMAWSPTLGWLFLGRAIAGAAGAVYGPAGSVIADVTPPEKRGATFAFIGAAFGIGFVIGPAIGGLLAQFGSRAPFIAAAALALANAVMMFLFMPETLGQENRRPFRLRDSHIIGAFRPLFHAGNAAPLLVAWFVWQLAHMVYPATWSFWAAIRFGWDAKAIGWSLAFVGVIMACVQGGLTGPFIKRFGERRAMLTGMCSAGLAFYLFAFVTAGWQAYVLMAVSAFQGFVFPSFNGLLSRMVDAKHQGALQGGIGSMGSVSSIIGPLLLTQALATGVDHGFPGANFLLAAVLVTVAFAIIVWKVLDRIPAKAESASA
ncbi:MFS transporter [Sphingomonas sp.]|jgi:DHA1 family tetracycline resistance protein-like MFS transporter|uniref:MFS transporter n=1 Tax=Sphingomonas sp. TaxID=28214 RepID=UPI002E35F017|nr:MFS transporter [Sphingomonas sp.]HEX4694767.1 MFS transporter [Sphingomonas sp.]